MAYLVYPNDLQQHVEGTYPHRHMAYSQDHVTSTGSIYAYQTSGLPDTSGYSRTMAKQPSESLKAPAPLGQHYFVDHMMNPHPYSSIYPGIDINAIRRKNASRETTGPLKAWLRDHRKNPYPTKGEKVMLAIATRMTLTQVSTWFANARRRMKKDKNEDDEDDDRADLSNLEAHARADRSDSISSRLSQSSNEADTSRDLSDTSDIDDNSFRARQSRKCVQRLFSPEIRHSHVPPASSPDSLFQDTSSNHGSMLRLAEALDTSENIDVLNDDDEITKMPTEVTKIPIEKPKIWSISEIISSNRPAPSHVPTHYHNDHVEFTDSSLNMYMNPLSNFSQYLTNYSLPVHAQL